jgi:RimJ/RimL family protein N-acetyltransferase
MRDHIETDRLTLRPLRPADAGPIALWAGDIRVARQVGHLPHPFPPGAADAFIERSLAAKSGERAYAIDGARSGASEFLGVVALGGADGDATRGFRYWVGPPAWGLGYATEAGAAALADAFANPSLESATAEVFHDNAASRSVLEKLGFAEEARSEAYCLARGETVAALRLRLSRPGAEALR